MEGLDRERGCSRRIVPQRFARLPGWRAGAFSAEILGLRLSRSALTASAPRWDIFCVAVDNYGDIGVAWRLARQLAMEHGIETRFFVDDLATLTRLAPRIGTTKDEQFPAGVELRRWDGPQSNSAADPGDVVIEAFGCGLAAPYLAAMAARDRQPIWINLEYLSAEPWIEGCHALASRHATAPLIRYFFFPGVTAASGGLLRERDLFARRDRFRADPRAREALWRMLGIDTPGGETLVVSLFCYPNAPLPVLLDAWATGERPMLCTVPDGVASAALGHWPRGRAPRAGAQIVRGRLTLAIVPFVSQNDYDKLLWVCDVNFVRGEDSFVRAQWAAQPLVWNVYPQTESAHRLKLEAFLARYCTGLAADAATPLRALSLAWNGEGDAASAWEPFIAAREALSAHASRWAAERAGEADLASALVKFCSDRV
jgi:uncharacterized repeat protein (TIGR03837 family)